MHSFVPLLVRRTCRWDRPPGLSSLCYKCVLSYYERLLPHWKTPFCNPLRSGDLRQNANKTDQNDDVPRWATGDYKLHKLHVVLFSFWGSLYTQEPPKLTFQPSLIPHLTFPNRQDLPAESLQALQVLSIPLLVTFQLRTPIFDAGLGDVRVDAAGMLVPKAPSHLNDALEPRQHDVRFSGETGDVQAKTKSHSMHDPPNRHFRRRILGPDLAHVLRTSFWREAVGHTARSRGRSQMSLRRLPLTMILTKFAESSAASVSTLAISSGSAKW